MIDHWWATRPKRDLSSISDALAVFSSVAVDNTWSRSRELHIKFEEELEKAGVKRKGERRDASGSGGRTYHAWLVSLGLVFKQNSSEKVFLTLAGEAIMEGQSPVKILKEQILKYQFPSPFSLSSTSKNRVTERFKIHPVYFLLKLLSDERLDYYITEEEIAKIVILRAENESDKCYNYVVDHILAFRNYNDDYLRDNQEFIDNYCSVNTTNKYQKIMDVANTFANWLNYTQLISRDEGKIEILPEKIEEVVSILKRGTRFIDRPSDHEYFQRKYGLDPLHQKDTRNLTDTRSVTPLIINTQKIKQTFISLSLKKPIFSITSDLIDEIHDLTDIDIKLIENVLLKNYKGGALSSFMSNYFEMAFSGRDQATEFEIATTEIFKNVFNFEAKHLGQTGSLSAPDILIWTDEWGYQSIIDTKAYSKYSLNKDHKNTMIINYISELKNYSNLDKNFGFYLYLAGGFSNTFDKNIKEVSKESNVHGAGISVSNMISMIEKHQEKNYTHDDIRKIFSVDRQVLLSDL